MKMDMPITHFHPYLAIIATIIFKSNLCARYINFIHKL